ncbi:MAG: rod shape-determining protein RodA [Clostridia bacterium]|nr:rod shape-determining protein RodA [Clostridia bacterium]
MQRLKRFFTKGDFIRGLVADIRANRFAPSIIRHFDWLLFLAIICLAAFGIVSIFSATTAATDVETNSVSEMLSVHSITYPRLQLIWFLAGTIAMCAVIFVDFKLYEKYADIFYWFNIILLLLVLTVKAGRGGMTAFFNWGSESAAGGQRGFQPSEFGKFFIIVSLARTFANRKKPIRTFRELVPVTIYVAIPLVLVFLQPDFGTALVYVAIFAVLLWVSGTNLKLIAGILAIMLCILIPAWYYLNASSTSFRLTRILMWLNPEDYPDDARQVINGQIAIGTGGLTGRGLATLGSFASLGFIPDDHTDFCFAIVGETFGFVGACAVIFVFAFLLGRIIYHSYKITDKFGSYCVIGVAAMFLFHILENICMILGILPVTGIPLPFISYGGSNMLTNMLCVGLVMNVVMRTKASRSPSKARYAKQL